MFQVGVKGLAATTSQSDSAQSWRELSSSAPEPDLSRNWLRLLCENIKGVSFGLLLLGDNIEGGCIRTWPENRRDTVDLLRVCTRAITDRREVVFWAKADPGSGQRGAPGLCIAYPLIKASKTIGVVCIELVGEFGADLPGVLRQLHWASGWMEALSWREEKARGEDLLQRALAGLDLVAAAGGHTSLSAAALAVANQLAAATKSGRVSIGLEKSGNVSLTAISHSARFQRRSRLVDAIERAMEEALDQDGSVCVPVHTSTERRISAAHVHLLKEATAGAVLTVPLSGSRGAIGAITIERHTPEPFDQASITMCEVVGSVVGPLFEEKRRSGRWLAGRAVDNITLGLKHVIGPGHLGAKLGALATVAGLSYLGMATGEHRIAAKSVLEGAIQHAAVAPFEGFIAEAPARAGDTVHEGQVLAVLDDRDLVLERARLRSEGDKLTQKYRETLAKHDRAGMGVLVAQIRQTEAQLALVEEKIRRAQIVAPYSGLVVSGDLSQMLGSPVEKGKVLFEVAPLGAFRVVVQVEERDLRFLEIGNEGQLAVTGMPDSTLPITVQKITPVTSAEEGKNVFKVEARLDQADQRLRPGMEGVAKISAGRENLLWIWTRSFMDWVRLTIWKWSL